MLGEGGAPIDKTFAILEAVVGLRRPVTLTDIATATRMATPTVHRIVNQLIERQMLRRYLTTRRILPGPRLTRLGLETIQAQIYSDRPHSILKALALEVGEFALISTIVDDEQICIDSASVHRPTGLHFEQGVRAPLHCTSIGKLYLAELSDKHFDNWLRHSTLKAYSNSTITDAQGLRRQCLQIRKLGYASCNEEYNPGVVGCGVKLDLPGDSGFIGLCISAPVGRLNFNSMLGHVPKLKTAARKISLEFQRSHRMN
jgi:IclR family acetate operon transcriptional repressor